MKIRERETRKKCWLTVVVEDHGCTPAQLPVVVVPAATLGWALGGVLVVFIAGTTPLKSMPLIAASYLPLSIAKTSKSSMIKKKDLILYA
jgi:hypothetical protein